MRALNRVLSVLCVAGLITACAVDRTTAVEKTVVIQVVVPDTGGLTAFGAQIRHGVQAAVDAANENRRGGPTVKAEFVDDGCDTDRAADVARELVAKNALVVLGHVCSGGSLPASDIYAKAGIPMVSAASSSVSLTERGLTNVFRVALRADIYAEGAAGVIARRFPKGRIAVVYETTDVSGRGHAEQVMRLLGESGITPTFRRGMASSADAAAVAQELISNKIDVVFYGGHFPEQLGALLKVARKAGFNGQFVSNDGAANAKLWPESDGAAQDLLYTFGADLRSTPEAANAVTRIRKTGFEPDGFTLNAYAATELIVQGLRQKPKDGKALISNLRTQTFSTAIGPVAFDAKGDLKAPRVSIYRWSDGQSVADNQANQRTSR